MLSAIYCKSCEELAGAKANLLIFLLTMMPAVSSAEIIWNGDFSTGDFTQWHDQSDSDIVTFHGVPAYGRPIQYDSQHPIHVGDGSLLSLVASTARTVDGIYYPQGPTRGSEYSAKFTVKSSVNGSEPADYDTNGSSDRRRTELHMHATLPNFYNAMPYMSERWMSLSHYVPSDWDDSGSGWGPLLFQVKPVIESGERGLSPCISIALDKGVWTLIHAWDEKANPSMDDVPWQQNFFYTGDYDGQPYPRSDFWAEGLRDYPDVAASIAALQSVNKGGWTDWVMHVKFDARGASEGGQGFLTIWKREDSGPWTKILHILPKETTRGGLTLDHGICYNSPPTGSSNGGFGPRAGMYLAKDQVWGLPDNRVVYVGNVKIGDERSSLVEMAPDIGPVAQGSAPKPPASFGAQ